MSFELILLFLRPIESLLLDESISEIMGNPDASWWYERDAKRFLMESVFKMQHVAPSAPSAAPIANNLLANSAQKDSLIPLPIKENPHATA